MDLPQKGNELQHQKKIKPRAVRGFIATKCGIGRLKNSMSNCQPRIAKTAIPITNQTK
jgi:hypothetical protein